MLLFGSIDTTMVANNAFARAIDGGFRLVTLVLMGAIIGASARNRPTKVCLVGLCGAGA
jgi:hypothetical protein